MAPDPGIAGPMILALDPATVTGFAFGRPGETPRFGSRGFGGHGITNGEVIGKFRAWLLNACYKIKPGLITFESPYVPRPKKGKSAGSEWAMNALTLRRLYAIAGEVETVAWELRIECLEATTSEICKFFTGRGSHGGRDQKKAAIIARARQYGWNVKSDDEADAVALWAMAENVIDPVRSSARGDGALFLPLAPPVDPKPKIRGRRKPAEREAEQPVFV